MFFHFITLHPQFIESYFEFGIFKKATDLGLAEFSTTQLRDFAVDDHGSVDSKPYGGGTGMVLRPEPLANATKAIKEKHPDAKVILLSPQGKTWQQGDVYEFMEQQNTQLIFICGRFEGIDQRFIDLYVDQEVSVGSYVISGGELAALTVADSLLRHNEGLLKESTLEDSSAIKTNQKTPPVYSRPEIFEGKSVPNELTSGNHALIEKWKKSFK